MTTDTEAMRIAEKRARGARKTLESSRRSNRREEQETVASIPVAEETPKETPKERQPKRRLRHRLALLLCGALIALALAVGAFVVFSPEDRAPSNGFDGSSAPAIDVGGPNGFDPRP